MELIGRSVALKKRGKDFVGLCPFHQEKTASFHVSAEKQYFRCFGCKKAGNAIDFVIEQQRVEFKDALRLLAEAANIELPAYAAGKKDTSERQVLLEAHSAACMFFENLLARSEQGEAARKYLAERGFDAESIQRFRIGVAPAGWDGLLKSPAMRKFTPQQLALAGLVKPRERGDGYYDTFRDRLIFPIRDENGRVIAFGGRVMPGSDDAAKYLNSPETPLFSKSRCVFGLDLARSKIVETRTAAVVEGYTDVVMAHQFGASNVVSVLGTALTPQHVAMLRRFADRIVLLFDADSAGDTAANRAVELLLTEPVEIAIASLPPGIDPDELLLKEGVAGLNEILAGATDALTYKWKQLVRRFQSGEGITSQQQAVQEYLQTLAAARDTGPVDGLRWGAALSRVSRLVEIPVEELNRRFKAGTHKRSRVGPARGAAHAEQFREPNNNAHVGSQNSVAGPINGSGAAQLAPPGPTSAGQKAEGFILGLLLLEPGRWSEVQQHIGPTDFTDPRLRQIAEIYWQYQQDQGEPVFNEFLGMLDAELKPTAMDCVEEASNAPDMEISLVGSFQHLSEERSREDMKKLIARLRRTTSEESGKTPTPSDDLDALRQLQEKARQPDLKRVGF
ncbi:MAG: DNA primase [Planctomycetota bacterium]|nr:DNA primase [Planctomycetota bacterium]